MWPIMGSVFKGREVPSPSIYNHSQGYSYTEIFTRGANLGYGQKRGAGRKLICEVLHPTLARGRE